MIELTQAQRKALDRLSERDQADVMDLNYRSFGRGLPTGTRQYTLDALSGLGLVEVTLINGGKRYHITDAGREARSAWATT